MAGASLPLDGFRCAEDFSAGPETTAVALNAVTNLLLATPRGQTDGWKPLLPFLHVLTQNWSPTGHLVWCSPIGEADHVLLGPEVGKPNSVSAPWEGGLPPAGELLEALEACLAPGAPPPQVNPRTGSSSLLRADWAPSGVPRIPRWQLARMLLEHILASRAPAEQLERMQLAGAEMEPADAEMPPPPGGVHRKG